MHKCYYCYAPQNGKVFNAITAQFEVVRYRFSLSYQCLSVLNNLSIIIIAETRLRESTIYYQATRVRCPSTCCKQTG